MERTDSGGRSLTASGLDMRVIETNGGTLVERFHKSKAYGGAESLRFRIALSDAAA
jgi:hypothetical protein